MRLESLLEAIPDAAILINQQGMILMMNSQAEKLFGYKTTEMENQIVELLISQRFREHHLRIREEYLSSEEERRKWKSLEIYGLKKNGEEFQIDLHLSPILSNGNYYFLLTCKSLTDAKKQEAWLKQLNSELEQFVYVASHNLQEPLNTLQQSAFILQKRLEHQIDAESKIFLNGIVHSSERMSQLIHNLLLLLKVNQGSLVVDSIECEEILQEIFIDLGTLIHTTKADIKVLSPLPSIRGYPLEFKQLLQNLITNGIKFQKPGTPPQILLSAEETSTEWIFSVKDHGVGIDPAFFTKLFEPFHRYYKHSEYEGTGIGLAYCKKIANLHEGKIWAESTFGEGSTFYFSIAKDLYHG